MKLRVSLAVLLVLVFTAPVGSAYTSTLCNEVKVTLHEDYFTVEYKGCHLKLSYALFGEADADKNGYVSYDELKAFESYLTSKNIRLYENDHFIDGQMIPLNNYRVLDIKFLNMIGHYVPNDPSYYPIADFTIRAHFDRLESGAHTFKAHYKYLVIKRLIFETAIPNSRVVDASHGHVGPTKVEVSNFGNDAFTVTFEVKRSIPFVSPLITLTVLTAAALLLRKRSSR